MDGTTNQDGKGLDLVTATRTGMLTWVIIRVIRATMDNPDQAFIRMIGTTIIYHRSGGPEEIGHLPDLPHRLHLISLHLVGTHLSKMRWITAKRTRIGERINKINWSKTLASSCHLPIHH